MLKTWGIYLGALISAFIFFIFYKMWVAWFILVVLLSLPVLSFLLCLFATYSTSFFSKAPVSIHIGTEAYIDLTIEGIATYFSFFKIKTSYTDYMGDRSENISVVIHDNGLARIPVDTAHCGAYSYRITKLYIYDILGFFHMTRRIDKEYPVIVKPIASMPAYIPDVYGFRAKNLRKSNQPVSEIYDIRDYQPGDSVKTIHWKISAKKDKLLVKEALEEFGGHSRLLLKFSDDRDKLDLHLGQILFTSNFLLDHEIPHKIRVIPPNRTEISFDIETETDQILAFAKILRMKVPKGDSNAT